MSIFDLRSLLPRERRRTSHREVHKGVTGNLAGKSRSPAEEAKRAARRARKRAHVRAALQALQTNPPGSKLARKFAKNAGLRVEMYYENGNSAGFRRPTGAEALAWYARLEEAPMLEGHTKRFAPPELVAAQAAFKAKRKGEAPVCVTG